MLNIRYYRNDKQLGKDLLELGLMAGDIKLKRKPGRHRKISEDKFLDAADKVRKKIEWSRGKDIDLKILEKLGDRELNNREVFLLGYIFYTANFNSSSSQYSFYKFLKGISAAPDSCVKNTYEYWDVINGTLKEAGLITVKRDKLKLKKVIKKALMGAKIEKKNEETVDQKFKSPGEIKEELDKYVIGQERPKTVISKAAYSYIENRDNGNRNNFPNVLMIGPTGSGKTHLIRTLADVLDFPVVTTDATQLTRRGYVGGNVIDAVYEMQQKMKKNNSGQNGIIYIDEIDKTAAGLNQYRDVTCRPVQEELLKLLDGGRIKDSIYQGGFKGRKKVDLDVSGILFVCGGSFQKFETGSSSIGFAENFSPAERMEKWTNHDLIEFGFIPELLGRLPVRLYLKELQPDQLVEILRNPRVTPFKNFESLVPGRLTAEDIPEEDLFEIAEETCSLGLGARGLMTVLEEYLSPKLYGDENFKSKKIC